MEVKGVDECMLKEYLEKTYGRNEPIFINEIRLEGVNDNSDVYKRQGYYQ